MLNGTMLNGVAHFSKRIYRRNELPMKGKKIRIKKLILM